MNAFSPSKPAAVAMWSWVLCDFGNHIFQISVLGYFFPLWLGDELGAGPSFYNYITAASMLLVALSAPFFGAVADLRQRRKPYLVVFATLTTVFTAGLDLAGSIAAAAVVFVIANFAFQLALTFYNSLLPGVSGGRGAGRVSGYGLAVGYIGTIFAVLVLTLFVTRAGEMRSLLGPLGGWIQTVGNLNANAFLPTAGLYLLFGLPAFLFIPDQRRVRPVRPVSVRVAYRGVFTTVRTLRRYTGLGAFMVATVLYTDAANTAISNMSLYGREVFGMDQAEIRTLLLFSTVFAAVGAASFGFMTDRFGPKRVLIIVLATWLGAIAFAATAMASWMLLVAGPLVGIALGGTWVVSRVMLIALSPAEKLGEFFGFYSLGGRFSAVTGPALTAVLLTVFPGPGGYRLAVFSLAVIVLAALLILLRVPDKRPERLAEELSRDG